MVVEVPMFAAEDRRSRLGQACNDGSCSFHFYRHPGKARGLSPAPVADTVSQE